jgi:hypothetical protein
VWKGRRLCSKFEILGKHSEDLGVDGKIILEWILGKQGRKMWTGCMWRRIGTSSGLL